MAEGKLRSLMQKRVKQQLRLMRKNSLRISMGLVSYIKENWEPKMKPTVEKTYEFIFKIAKRLGLVTILERVRKIISHFPFLERQLVFLVYLILIPLNVYSGLAKRRKTKRSRSVRSESLRRRLAEGNKPLVPLFSNQLNRSAEIINEENITAGSKLCDEEDSICNRDSALASSMDDIPTSDSTDTTFRKTRKEKACTGDQNGFSSNDNGLNLRIEEENDNGLKLKIEEENDNGLKLKIEEENDNGLKLRIEEENETACTMSPRPVPRLTISSPKEDIADAAYLLSPRFKRKNPNRRLKFEHRQFVSEEHMPENTDTTFNGNKESQSDSHTLPSTSKKDKKRRISFTL